MPLDLSRFLRSRNPDDPRVRAARTRDVDRTIELCRALLTERGEVSGARVAAEVLGAYQRLSEEEVEWFFDRLVTTFSVDAETVRQAAAAYRLDASPANLLALQEAVEPPRQELFRRCNMAPGGTAVLVEMRRRLLRTLGDHPHRAEIDADLTHLFRSWFNRGFLTLARIDWQTSAVVLERLIQYEAVHQIQGWHDLRRRLESDRRCYAFFHPALPQEPLIFIEVALTRAVTAQVQPLLDPDSRVDDPARATCAIFYSITNCQQGLRGVSFGNVLIKQVVDDLGKEFPNVRTFATLSPIPGFRSWLAERAATAPGSISPALATLVAKGDDIAAADIAIAPGALREEMMQRCARYLISMDDGRGVQDPVARFHLANGARLERLNWMGDTSATGLRRSYGLTVNYVYRLADLERNHDAYANKFRVASSIAFRQLTKPRR
ncbi:MAG TPA: malonyl-CoA decarboxylase [Vicinamibacterales bacterium]|nr:malonyl-CoA decarboxylase [Vicinamibacterales bacterium]